MEESKRYILEIPEVLSEETTIYLEADARLVKSLFAIVEISDGGVSIVDNCYRTISEAQSASGGNSTETVPPDAICGRRELYDRRRKAEPKTQIAVSGSIGTRRRPICSVVFCWTGFATASKGSDVPMRRR